MLTIKTTLAFPIGFLLLSVTCTASPECADGVCPLPEENGETAQAAVFMTLPASAIQPIVQAPRLKSLDGKTIALVGGSFMASVTHPDLKGSFSKSSRRPRSISCAKSDRPAPIRVPARSVRRKTNSSADSRSSRSTRSFPAMAAADSARRRKPAPASRRKFSAFRLS